MIPARSAAAIERLSRSRERLRAAIQGPTRSSGSGSAAAAPWLARVLTIPGIGLVVEALHSWWQHHPLQLAGSVAADTVKGILTPVVRRNPLGLMFGAALLGGLLAWTRPWRWLARPAFITGLLPQLVHEALAQVPLQSVLLALAALGRHEPTAGPAAEPVAEPPDTKGPVPSAFRPEEPLLQSTQP